MRSKILFFTVVTFLTYGLNAQLVINEYSGANMNTITDAAGDTPDWIEIYNNSGAAVMLDNYFLSDKATNPLKWQMPAVNLPAGGRILFFASSKNTLLGANYHTNFKLTQSEGNDVVMISDAAANIIDVIDVDPTLRNHSRGRTTDGAATWSVFATPTPNAVNTGARTYATKPTMSMAAGNYPGAIAVSITSPDPGVTIRYTTDGMEPTAASTAYVGPIAVGVTTVIRARAFSATPTVLPSFIESNTYFIGANHTIPVLSVMGDYPGLFAGWGGEIETHAEYFNTSYVQEFETYGEANPHGNDSWAYPQKGFGIVTKDEEGYDEEMDCQIFDDSSRDRFQKIIVKAGASDNYPFGPPNGAHIRDAFVQSYALKNNLHMDGRRLKHCAVYINGQYWGLYELREKSNDKDFTEYYYNQDEDEIDIIGFWGGLEVNYGSTANWDALYTYITTNSMAVAANYDYVQTQMDIMSVIDNYIYNTYIVNSDWISWNTRWWRGFGSPGVKWKYMMWDLDNVYNLGQNFSGWPTTGMSADPCDLDAMFGPGSGSSMGHLEIFNRLMENDDFKNTFITRYADLLNGPLSCNRIKAHLDSLKAIMDTEMPRQIARWGGSMAEWNSRMDFLYDQIDERCTVINAGVVDCYDVTGPYNVTVSVAPAGSGNVNFQDIQLSTYPWSANYFGGTNIDMIAQPNATWIFDYWEIDNHVLSPSINATDVTFLLNQADNIVAHFKKPDSMSISYNVFPPGAGKINLNGTLLPYYMFRENITVGEVHNVAAIPNTGFAFDHWELNHHIINPSTTDSSGVIVANMTDTVVAVFKQLPPPPPPTLYFPNSFTPNGDNLNDFFELFYNYHLVYAKVKIFNRWGDLIFQANEKEFTWDGTYKGKPAQQDVYSIQIEYMDDVDMNPQLMYGHVTLIR